MCLALCIPKILIMDDTIFKYAEIIRRFSNFLHCNFFFAMCLSLDTIFAIVSININSISKNANKFQLSLA